MERTVFFDHYRLATGYDGAPREIGRSGAAIVYKASDIRSGAPVALTLLPVERIAPDQRARFEEQARTALLLDHMNIVRTVAFDREDENFVFVSEYPPGDTLASWVNENGPMPPDAVLRVALQVVSALGAASFHRIHHRGLEPANMIIVAGQTAEGGWPCVKLTNYAVAGQTRGGDANEFASPEQLRDGTVDFRSEIYSLGATICFLLTGAYRSAEAPARQVKRFARPLRKVIGPMLRQSPAERPQDPMAIALVLRACLQRVEQRLALSRKFGFPFIPVKARPVGRRLVPARPRSLLAGVIETPVASRPGDELAQRPPRVWLRRPLTTAALLLAAATVAAVLLPAPVSLILRQHRGVETVGIPPGIAPDSSTPVAPEGVANLPAMRPRQMASGAPHSAMSVPSMPVAQASVDASQSVPSVVVASNSPGSDVVAANDSSAALPPAQGPETVWERAAGREAHPRIAQQNETSSAETNDAHVGDGATNSPSEPTDESSRPPVAATKSGSDKSRTASTPGTTKKRISSSNSRSDQRFAQDPATRARRTVRRSVHGSVPARIAGIAPDGSVILRFRNGQTTILPPPGYYLPGLHRVRRPRVIIERRPWWVPPPPYALFRPPGP